jgi:hypothetical protein
LDKSNELNEEQPKNMNSIFLTLEVIKFDNSKLINEEHPENILLIDSTLDVSKLDNTMEVKEEQLDKFIDVIEEQLKNIFSIEVIEEVSEFDKSTSTIFFKQ